MEENLESNNDIDKKSDKTIKSSSEEIKKTTSEKLLNMNENNK